MSLKKQIPNALTLSRVIIALLVLYAIYNKNFGLALSLFLLALITDGFDGYLARRWKVVSFIGEEIFETLSDGLLIFLSVLGLTLINVLPLWLFLVMCIGALFFLTYTRKSKSEKVKDLTIVIQILGYSGFNLSIILYLSLKISLSVALLTLIFLATAVYLKKDRLYFALEHGHNLFHHHEKKI